ncbi:MAG: hypothetical protein AAFR38_11590 [Planctomycetota bacterium]
MKLLVVSHYSEPLKAVLPVIEGAISRGHHVDVAHLERVADDRARSAAVIEGVPVRSEFVPLEPLIEESMGRVAGPARAVAVNQAESARVRDLLDRSRPDAVVLLNEHMGHCRWLIHEANRRGVLTCFFQWGIGNASTRHTLEMAARKKLGPDFAQAAESSPAQLAAWLSARSRAKGPSLIGVLDEHAAPPPVPAPYWGCGNARIAAVMGRGSEDTFTALGGAPGRCRVVGSTVYEPLVRRRDEIDRSPEALRHARVGLGLPEGGPLVLWATNDQQTYWDRAHARGAMCEAWLAARDAVLSADPRANILLKIHPKESPEQYRSVWEGQPRVRVMHDADVWRLLESVDVCLTRFSSVAFSAVCLGVPAVTMNFPPVPGGTLFEDIGGTLHANAPAELRENIRMALSAGHAHDLRRRADRLIERFLDIAEQSPADRTLRMLEVEFATMSPPPIVQRT